MNHPASSIMPCLSYKDAPAAIEWLCWAFGFQKHLVVEGKDGSIVHSELILGNAMIMVGSLNHESAFGKLTKPPQDIGGTVTQSPYIVIENPDEHYTRAVEAGARIVLDIKTEDYGGRGYSCLDPEGHLWNFGSYDPWKTNK